MNCDNLTAQRLAWAAVPILATGVLGQALWFDRTLSVTFDETFYANCAIKTVRIGRIDDRFAEYGVAPVPILLCYGPPALFLGGESERDPFRGNASHFPIVSVARIINSLLSGVGLVLLVFCWLWKRVGPVGASVGVLYSRFVPRYLRTRPSQLPMRLLLCAHY